MPSDEIKKTGPPEPGAVLDLEKKDPARAEALWHGLAREQRLRTLLKAPPKERVGLITLAADSRELVEGLSAQEFSRTVLELGPDDAGMLVELCSDEQLTYLLDLTGWRNERFAPVRYEAWLPLVMNAGPARLGRWLKSTDLEVLALLFAHWFKVVKFLPSQDEQEPPDNLPAFTLDGVYFIDFRNQDTAGFVAQVLVQLRSEDEKLYQKALEAMLWEPAVQMAEDALRWRAGRLRDHGFPDRLEGLELWAKSKPGEFDWEGLPPKLGLETPPGLTSDHGLGLLPPDELLPRAVGDLTVAEADQLTAELAHAANSAAVALGADPALPEEVDRAAREGLGLVNMGLGLLSGNDPRKAAAIISRLGAPVLARKGAAALRDLNHRAFLLVDQGWLKGFSTGLHLLNQPLDRWLAGLLYPRPRCYDPALGQGKEYRPFLGLADLELASRRMEMAEFWGRLLFELMGMDHGQAAGILEARVWPKDPMDIKVTHLVGTWLARRALGLEGLEPIPRADLPKAVQLMQQGLKGPLAQEALASCQALEQPEASSLASKLLRGALDELSLELGRINASGDIEPAFLGGLVVER